MRKSIVQTNYCCFVCGTTEGLHSHEVFYGTANRKKSIQDKMVVYLCGKHHNLSSEGVHENISLDTAIKQIAQEKWEETYGNREDFIKRYGRSYLPN